MEGSFTSKASYIVVHIICCPLVNFESLVGATSWVDEPLVGVRFWVDEPLVGVTFWVDELLAGATSWVDEPLVGELLSSLTEAIADSLNNLNFI